MPPGSMQSQKNPGLPPRSPVGAPGKAELHGGFARQMATQQQQAKPRMSLRDFTLGQLLEMAGFETDGYDPGFGSALPGCAAPQHQLAEQQQQEQQLAAAGAGAGLYGTTAYEGSHTAVTSSLLDSTGKPHSTVVLAGTAATKGSPPQQLMMPSCGVQFVTAATPAATKAAGAAGHQPHAPSRVPVLGLRNPVYPFGPPPVAQQQQQQQQQHSHQPWHLQDQPFSSQGIQTETTSGFANLDQLADAVMLMGPNSFQQQQQQQEPQPKRKRGRPRKYPLPGSDLQQQAYSTTGAGEDMLEALLQWGSVDTSAVPRELLEEQQRILDSYRGLQNTPAGSKKHAMTKYSQVQAAAAAAAAASARVDGSDVGFVTRKRHRRSYGWYLLEQAQAEKQAQAQAEKQREQEGSLQTDHLHQEQQQQQQWQHADSGMPFQAVQPPLAAAGTAGVPSSVPVAAAAVAPAMLVTPSLAPTSLQQSTLGVNSSRPPALILDLSGNPT